MWDLIVYVHRVLVSRGWRGKATARHVLYVTYYHIIIRHNEAGPRFKLEYVCDTKFHLFDFLMFHIMRLYFVLESKIASIVLKFFNYLRIITKWIDPGWAVLINYSIRIEYANSKLF